jgi:hypothetical protein
VDSAVTGILRGPSFRGVDINWNADNPTIKAYRRRSIALLKAQYEALARMALLARRPLHLTAVGMELSTILSMRLMKH